MANIRASSEQLKNKSAVLNVVIYRLTLKAFIKIYCRFSLSQGYLYMLLLPL